MSDEQHREDTKYLQWSEGMYVMIDALECDYELALIENSLRDSVYFIEKFSFTGVVVDDCAGVYKRCAGYWYPEGFNAKLTRAQALYIATGDVII
jgi:hypothetical protein